MTILCILLHTYLVLVSIRTGSLRSLPKTKGFNPTLGTRLRTLWSSVLFIKSSVTRYIPSYILDTVNPVLQNLKSVRILKHEVLSYFLIRLFPTHSRGPFLTLRVNLYPSLHLTYVKIYDSCSFTRSSSSHLKRVFIIIINKIIKIRTFYLNPSR